MRLASWAGLGASLVTTVHGVHNLHPQASLSDRDTPVDIPLEVFQVEAPVRQTYDGAACSSIIVQHDFTASYGTPFVGTYSPPSDCNFTTVVFNMTITSTGINYDRLALLYFGDLEVWRSTTAMPVRTGVYYSFVKDMTVYASLLREEQKVIMQMDNIYNSVFTGNFNVTITAFFYKDEGTVTPADVILPISSQSSVSNKTSVFSLPDGNATVTLSFPRNVERAVVSIFASGNGNEEFWYADVPGQFTSTFETSFANGYSPWREVQVLIDGQLAGVSWPFPIVFTGGISPGLWVPIVGIDTYDLGSVDVDISPWLGLLCDGSDHVFELKVVGYNSSKTLGTVASNWWVSGEIFLWLDEGGNQTTGGDLKSFVPEPTFDLYSATTTYNNGSNSSLLVELSAHRSLILENTINTSTGTRLVTWGQDLSYLNIQNITAAGYNDTLWQSTNGSTTFSSATSNLTVTALYEYPISFGQDYIVPTDPTVDNSTVIATLDRSKITYGDAVLSRLTYASPATSQDYTVDTPMLKTRQNGSCFYLWNNTYYEFAGAIDPAVGTLGGTDQWFSWAGYVETDEGREFEEYGRYVSAIDGYEPILVQDKQVDQLIDVPETTVVTGAGFNEL
ncbi:Peptide-N4-(N-acetyl-beta-glucosaminyl)asparagine amidase A [Cytospora mali]|uniref:Peptide-N4-(N-acetyl-beta-glucosaminyl)asparagine amidase A n=1 Tax=Cytospora mali TaxID=578113 RepID=A0A194UUL3_CYTMA|nr:Peptide-N4-(N-acetyl-beta-glucosaminyl)asparagine amidase A [Valsa mali var. pyri (nom. inval.)]